MRQPGNNNRRSGDAMRGGAEQGQTVLQMRDPYSVLGVKRDAGADEIKAAWRSIAKSAHPDSNRDDPTATRRFAEIGEAYDLLRDPQKRQRYDQARQRAEKKADEQTIMQQRNAAREAAARARAAREQAEKVMEELARNNARKPAADAGQTEEKPGNAADSNNPHDSMFERIFGQKPSPSYKAETASGTTGAATGETPIETPASDEATARGSVLKFAASDLIASFVRRIRGTPPPPEKLPDIMMDAPVTIENLIRQDRISVTTGDGREVRFNIEPGMTDGHVVTLRGQGLRVQGLPRGDLLLTLALREDPAVTVRGFDIHTWVAVSLEDAVLGCETEIATPRGPEKVTVPPWSGSDRTIRIEGKGLANADGGTGDLVVEIRIVLHEKPDEKVTDLMRHMRQGLYL